MDSSIPNKFTLLDEDEDAPVPTIQKKIAKVVRSGLYDQEETKESTIKKTITRKSQATHTKAKTTSDRIRAKFDKKKTKTTKRNRAKNLY